MATRDIDERSFDEDVQQTEHNTCPEGRAVTVYGYLVAGRSTWDLHRCYCEDCAPRQIHSPTLGVTELLAQAWLGTLAISQTRTHHLCLTEVELVEYSPPEKGAEP